MQHLHIKDHWGTVKPKLQKSHPALTEDDLVYKEGNEEELLDRLQKRTGKKRDDLIKLMNDFSVSL
ncbi:MAG: hypothetical protein U0V74_13070 [Chitinophagales bacterium]